MEKNIKNIFLFSKKGFLKKILVYIFVILIILSISIIAYNVYVNNYIQKNSFYENVDSFTAKKIIDKNKNNENFVILDLRTPEEYSSMRIENSVNINFFDENFKEELSKLEKDKTYLIYCKGGYRSNKTLELMKKLDFKKVYNLEKGILDWEKNNLPLVYS